MSFLNFDNALSSIYEGDSNIDPFIYLATYFDLLRNQVDLYVIENKIPVAQYLDLIQIIKDHETECIQNCHNHFDFIKKKIKEMIDKRIELNKETCGTLKFVERNLSIRNEWVEVLRVMFHKNLFFLESFEQKKLGCLVFVKSLLLDDQQIDTIKLFY